MHFSQDWSQNVCKLHVLLFNISVLNHVVMIVKFCKTLKAVISKHEVLQPSGMGANVHM